jgi:hypothetical protein
MSTVVLYVEDLKQNDNTEGKRQREIKKAKKRRKEITSKGKEMQ